MLGKDGRCESCRLSKEEGLNKRGNGYKKNAARSPIQSGTKSRSLNLGVFIRVSELLLERGGWDGSV